MSLPNGIIYIHMHRFYDPCECTYQFKFCIRHTLRGVGAKVIICDEMAFMNDEVLRQVIIPLLGVSDARLLGISTPAHTESNFFKRMLELKYHGTDEHVFGTLIIDLACDECKRKERAIECRHLLHMMPKWKDTKKFDLSKELYGPRHSHVLMRENMGLSVQAQDKIFPERWLNKMIRRPYWTRTTRDCKPSHIFISVDPNAGGSNQMAIVSVAWVQQVFMVSNFFFCLILYPLYTDC